MQYKMPVQALTLNIFLDSPHQKKNKFKEMFLLSLMRLPIFCLKVK